VQKLTSLAITIALILILFSFLLSAVEEDAIDAYLLLS
jgi:hypothetical protein